MRSLERCSQCGLGSMRVYVTRHLSRHVVRYKRCSHCRCTSKHVQMIFEIRYQSSTALSEIHTNERIIAADEQAIKIGNTNERFDDGHNGRIKPN